MKILNINVLRGPNFWSIRYKLIVAKIDIGKFEEIPTDKIPGFENRIKEALPGLNDHYCSIGMPGGFFERVKTGTWMGHVIEHIALEIQTAVGMNCGYGRTRGTGEKGVYNVIFAYQEEDAGIYAAHAAVRIAEALAEGTYYDIASDIKSLRQIAIKEKPGPSTSAIIDAAVARNIPYLRLDKGSLIQLGYGCMQRRIEATITDLTSTIAVDLASDKHKTKIFLRFYSIPVPEGSIVAEKDQLSEIIREIGFPIVIKPNNCSKGKGVNINVTNLNDAYSGFEMAKTCSGEVIVERFYKGNDYRLLVINNKLVAAARRTPAMVTGDGIKTIRQLVDKVNLDPLRGDEHENILTKIKLDKSSEDFLESMGLSPDYIPDPGEHVSLKKTANLSTGGTSEDVTELVHPDIKVMAERVAEIVGLDICGIDFISEDISLPLKAGKGVVIEVNAAPGLRMHTNPTIGLSRPVGEAVIEMLFEKNKDGRIPIVAITGTNGKTTTSRLIAHIAKTAGYKVGLTTSSGIYINGSLVEEGDCTGPVSAEKVLRDKNVNFAILECARGGMLQSGLAFDLCDVGIVTNVAEDHLGMKGINTLKEMAMVKSIIPEAVKSDGVAILNENNEYTYNMKDYVNCTVALFSTDEDSRRIEDHCRKGGLAAVYRERKIILLKGDQVILNEAVEDIPLAFNGKAIFMIENILAAILAAYSKNIEINYIVSGLHSFTPNYENIPGRMNIFQFRNFRFILDYAHNFHGITALGSFIRQEEAAAKVGIIAGIGDRRDVDIINIGKASAGIFDKIIIRLDEDTRGRNGSEIINLLCEGINNENPDMPLNIIEDECDAIKYAITNAEPDSLIVLFSENLKKSFKLITEYQEKDKEVTYEYAYSHLLDFLG